MRHPRDKKTANQRLGSSVIRVNPFTGRRQFWSHLDDKDVWENDIALSPLPGDVPVSYEDTWCEPEEE